MVIAGVPLFFRKPPYEFFSFNFEVFSTSPPPSPRIKWLSSSMQTNTSISCSTTMSTHSQLFLPHTQNIQIPIFTEQTMNFNNHFLICCQIMSKLECFHGEILNDWWLTIKIVNVAALHPYFWCYILFLFGESSCCSVTWHISVWRRISRWTWSLMSTSRVAWRSAWSVSVNDGEPHNHQNVSDIWAWWSLNNLLVLRRCLVGNGGCWDEF